MTDPLRRLRSLDDVPTRDLWSRIEGNAAGPEPLDPIAERTSLGRRVATIAVAFAVFSAGGLFLVTQFDRGTPGPPPSDDPVVQGATVDELMVTCTDAGAVVRGDVVALQADGVHVSVKNETDADFIYMRDPQDIERSFGIEVGSEQTIRHVMPLETGTWVAGCFSGTSLFNTHEVPLSAYSPPFQVVDPHGFADELQDAAVCGESLPEPVQTAGVDAPLSAPLDGWLTVQGFDHDSGEARAFFVRADGTEVEPIEVEAGQIQELELSPDGSKIALVIPDSDGDPTVTYASREDSEIYVMNRDGSELTRLTDNHASDDIVHWTPEGRLSFRSNRGGNPELYVMDSDGSNVGRLTNFQIADAHAWSPDGSRLAFVAHIDRDRDDGCRGSGAELHVANPDGSGLTALTEDELYQQAPAWSPDASTIAFTASNQSDYAWEILLVNADGSDLRRITDYGGYDQDPVWSPDGALLAFTSDRFLGPEPHGESQGGLPYVMNADGSGVRPLVDPDDLGIGHPWDIYVTDWRL